jgi:ribonuclease HI
MSWYVVKRGRIPGIYTDWSSCEKQIKGFSNAKFKKFENKKDAQIYLDIDDTITIVKPTIGIAVDAAYSLKRGEGEFQIFNLKENRIVYTSRIYTDVTVNIMEFLAIVKATQFFPEADIYSDSATAITWFNNKKIKSVGKCEEETQKEIDSAIDYLNNTILANRIIKWDTSKFGDIPADFGRK